MRRLAQVAGLGLEGLGFGDQAGGEVHQFAASAR